MLKNQTIILISGLLLIGSVLSCNLFGNKSVRTDKDNVIANSNDVSAKPKPSAADCPQTTFAVDETRYGALKKYEGCSVSVKGKIWEVNGDKSITLIDTDDKTNSVDSFPIGGDFSDDSFYKVGRNISDIKFKNQYERLPVATFTGTVDGDGWLENCVLTDVEK